MIGTVKGRLVGPGWSFEEAYDVNYAALAVAIVAHKTVDQSLGLLGIRPVIGFKERKKRAKSANALIHTVGQASYMLCNICGLSIRATAQYLHVSKMTVWASIKELKGDNEK